MEGVVDLVLDVEAIEVVADFDVERAGTAGERRDIDLVAQELVIERRRASSINRIGSEPSTGGEVGRLELDAGGRIGLAHVQVEFACPEFAVARLVTVVDVEGDFDLGNTIEVRRGQLEGVPIVLVTVGAAENRDVWRPGRVLDGGISVLVPLGQIQVLGDECRIVVIDLADERQTEGAFEEDSFFGCRHTAKLASKVLCEQFHRGSRRRVIGSADLEGPLEGRWEGAGRVDESDGGLKDGAAVVTLRANHDVGVRR